MLAHICAACSSPVLCAPPIILLPTNFPNSNTLTLSSLSPVKETTSFSSKHESIRSFTPTPNRHIPALHTHWAQQVDDNVQKRGGHHSQVYCRYIYVHGVDTGSHCGGGGGDGGGGRRRDGVTAFIEDTKEGEGASPENFRVVRGVLTTVISFPPREVSRQVTDFAPHRHMSRYG